MALSQASQQSCAQWAEQCTRPTPHGTPITTPIPAVLWALRGGSLHRIALFPRVLAQAGRNGMRACATPHDAQPDPTGKRMVLERDAKWHDVKNTRQTRWSGKAVGRERGPLLD